MTGDYCSSVDNLLQLPLDQYSATEPFNMSITTRNIRKPAKSLTEEEACSNKARHETARGANELEIVQGKSLENVLA